MTPIPVIARSFTDPNKVMLFGSIREAARTFGSEETIRKIIATECNEGDDAGVQLAANGDTWFVEYFASYVET